MSFLAAIPIIGSIIDKGLGIIDKAVPDKDLARKLKHEFESSVMSMDYSVIEKELDARAKIITSETGGAGIKAWWRPVTMLVFVYIVAHNYILAPIIQMFYPPMVVLEIPPDLWMLLKLGIGGYIVGRSGEKMIEKWKK